MMNSVLNEPSASTEVQLSLLAIWQSDCLNYLCLKSIQKTYWNKLTHNCIVGEFFPCAKYTLGT